MRISVGVGKLQRHILVRCLAGFGPRLLHLMLSCLERMTSHRCTNTLTGHANWSATYHLCDFRLSLDPVGLPLEVPVKIVRDSSRFVPAQAKPLVRQRQHRKLWVHEAAAEGRRRACARQASRHCSTTPK